MNFSIFSRFVFASDFQVLNYFELNFSLLGLPFNLLSEQQFNIHKTLIGFTNEDLPTDTRSYLRFYISFFVLAVQINVGIRIVRH